MYYTKGGGGSQVFFESNAFHTATNRYIYKIVKDKKTRLFRGGLTNAIEHKGGIFYCLMDCNISFKLIFFTLKLKTF
jgi:hypothetical protein